MPLPFKTENPILPNNGNIAEKCLDQLKRRLGKGKVLYDDYKAFIEMMFEKHYAEICPDIEDKSDVKWYIPHHAVYNPKKSSSARVVFDCAAVFHNKLLNVCLIQGTNLLNSLISVLCQFREHPIALMGDIAKMFYRFKVKKEHRDYLRFIWWKDSDMTLPPIDCGMPVHIFGAVSSPCCANFTLKRLANDNKTSFLVKQSNLFRISSM